MVEASLKYRGVGVLGVERARNIAEYAEREKGIPTLARFFGTELAGELAMRAAART